MGVERQTAKINWLTSFGMIVAAGTLFRLRGVLSKFKNLRVKELKQKAGLAQSQKYSLNIVPKTPSTSKGDWQLTLLHRQQYKIFSKLFFLLQPKPQPPKL